MNRKGLFIPILAALLLALLLPPACSKAAEYCDLRCACELCNNQEHEECVIEKAADLETASIYGCVVEYNSFLDCTMDRSECDEYSWSLSGDDCADEREEHEECVADASGYGGTGGSSSGTGGNGGNSNGGGGAGGSSSGGTGGGGTGGSGGTGGT